MYKSLADKQFNYNVRAHKNRAKDCIEMFQIIGFKLINKSSNRIVGTKGLERVNIP